MPNNNRRLRCIMRRIVGICTGFASFVIGLVSGTVLLKKESEKTILSEHLLAEKHLAMFHLMNQWVKNIQSGKRIEEYFLQKGIKTVAIYGMSFIGETLFDELINSDIEIVYCVDNSRQGIYQGKHIFSSTEFLEEVDAIVVTAITFYEDIKLELEKNNEFRVISLEEIIYEI